MTAPSDYPDDMGAHTQLDDRTVEDLLAGRPVHAPELADLAGVLAALHAVSDDCAPTPNAALSQILEQGLPTDAATRADPAVTAPATAGRIPGRSPGRLPRLAFLRGVPAMTGVFVAALLAKIAGLGVGAKTALALTAATAVAAGAAATDLPQTVSDAFDRGGEHAPADLPGDAGFGESVREDATDPADRGVDGPAVADDARERADQHRTDDAASDRDGPPGERGAGAPAPGGLDRADESTADTPARLPTEPGPDAAEGQRPADPPMGGPGAPRAPRAPQAPRAAPGAAPGDAPGSPGSTSPAAPGAEAGQPSQPTAPPAGERPAPRAAAPPGAPSDDAGASQPAGPRAHTPSTLADDLSSRLSGGGADTR